jgi:hypothetical protein
VGKTKEVMLMDFDISIIAIVFTLILIMVFFSAIVLYLSFRIKETFRKETRRGANIAKTAFLIGTLFLAGSIFYFAANSLTNINQPVTPLPTATPTSTPFHSPTSSPTNPVDSPSPSPNSSPSPATPSLSFNVLFPETVGMGAQLSISFTIINPTSTTAKNAVIQTNNLFQSFSIRSSSHEVVGSTVNIGNLASGTTVVTLELTAPSRPAQIDETVSLIYQEMPTQLTQQISINVRGK